MLGASWAKDQRERRMAFPSQSRPGKCLYYRGKSFGAQHGECWVVSGERPWAGGESRPYHQGGERQAQQWEG